MYGVVVDGRYLRLEGDTVAENHYPFLTMRDAVRRAESAVLSNTEWTVVEHLYVVVEPEPGQTYNWCITLEDVTEVDRPNVIGTIEVLKNVNDSYDDDRYRILTAKNLDAAHWIVLFMRLDDGLDANYARLAKGLGLGANNG